MIICSRPNQCPDREISMPGAKLMSNSRILEVNIAEPDKAVIAEAKSVLKQDGLVVAPTETMYGILANIESPIAVNRLFEVKSRSYEKPSAIFVKSIADIERLAELTSKSAELCRRFLPGPLTLILRSKHDLGQFFTKDGKTGFRISSAPLIKKLLEETGPLSATSANLSGRAEPKSVPEIYAQLGDRIDLYLDFGELNNPTSTVVEIVDDQIKILREGAISSNNIYEAFN